MLESEQPSSLASRASVIVLSRAISIAAKMAAIMILTRILTKNDFGLLSFILLAYTLVSTLCQLGLPDSVFYFFERVPRESRKSLALLTGKTLILVGLGGSAILVALTFLAPLWGFPVDGLFLPMILLVLLELPTTPLPNILIAIERAKAAAWLNIVFSLTQFTALVVPAGLGQPVRIIIFSLLAYGVIRFALSAFVFFASFEERGGPLAKGMVFAQLRYSVPVGLAQILWGLNRTIDKFIVSAFLPVAVFAEYVVGAWEIPLIPMIAYSVASVMMPEFVASHLEGRRDDLVALWFKSIEKVSIIVLPFMVLFLVIAEEFIAVLFSEAYVSAALPFRIYTLLLLQRVTSYSSILKAVGDTGTITYHAIYMISLNLVLSIPLVLLWGVAGPPTATVLASLVTWVYLLVKIRHALGLSLKGMFPFGFYVKALAVSALSAGPVILLDSWIDASYGVELVLKTAAYLVVFALASRATGVSRKEDWSFLGKLVGLRSAT